VLEEQRDRLARFVAERAVQTNEVQRTWALLPAFLTVARSSRVPVELVELGPSAGLNLIWDRYGFRYGNGGWGDLDSDLVLDGEERSLVPRALLEQRVEIAQRIGIDLEPIDVTTDAGARLLECFIWADQPERIDRLRRAIELLRRNPPELIAGDYTELLPSLLARRRDDALTVVFQTASTGYLSDEKYARVLDALDKAGAEGPLAWISTRRLEEMESPGRFYELEGAIWPDGSRRVLGLMHYHGYWLDWRG